MDGWITLQGPGGNTRQHNNRNTLGVKKLPPCKQGLVPVRAGGTADGTHATMEPKRNQSTSCRRGDDRVAGRYGRNVNQPGRRADSGLLPAAVLSARHGSCLPPGCPTLCVVTGDEAAAAGHKEQARRESKP